MIRSLLALLLSFSITQAFASFTQVDEISDPKAPSVLARPAIYSLVIHGGIYNVCHPHLVDDAHVDDKTGRFSMRMMTADRLRDSPQSQNSRMPKGTESEKHYRT